MQQTIALSTIKKLVDLNGDTINFLVKFTAKTKNGEPFYLVVANQTTLDNSEELNYEKVEKGEISGEVKSNDNVYQNFFLVLKSDKPCECTITIDKQEIPGVQIMPAIVNKPEEQKETNWLRIVLIVVVIAIVGYFLYNWYVKKGENSKGDSKGDGKRVLNSPRLQSVAPSIANSVAPSVAGSETNNNFLDRLKRLKIDK